MEFIEENYELRVDKELQVGSRGLCEVALPMFFWSD
jgi:hypothetical protein